MSANIPWPEFWAFTEAVKTKDGIKKLVEIFDNEFYQWVGSKSHKTQVEILSGAPFVITQALSPILKPEARKKLGL